MTRRIFTLANARLVDVAVDVIREAFAKRPGSRVEIKGPKRSNDQNAAMWAMLGDIAEQVDSDPEAETVTYQLLRGGVFVDGVVP